MIKSLNGIKATNAMMFTHDGLLIWILKTMPYGFAEHICLLHLSMRTCFSWKVHHKIQLLLNVQYFNLIVLWFQWGNNCSALVCSNLTKFTLLFRDMFCAGRVPDEDLKRTLKACGGSIQTTCQNLASNVLGSCEKFEEIQIGGER